MESTEVGVRDLKAHLSAHLARVKTGATITVTARGRPVARLVPAGGMDIPPTIAALIDAGEVRWSGQRLPPHRPMPVAPGEKSMAQFISEGRDGRD